MNLREFLLSEHSKAQCVKIVKWIGNDQQRFNQLFNLFLNEEYRIVQRAAWPISYAVQACPPLIKPHFGKLLNNLEKQGLPDSVKRNTVRLLQEIDIPERFQGQLMNLCFNYIGSLSEKAAVKAYALTILYNMSKKYPEIRHELKSIIEDRWEYETAAFRSRGRKILKQLEIKK